MKLLLTAAIISFYSTGIAQDVERGCSTDTDFMVFRGDPEQFSHLPQDYDLFISGDIHHNFGYSDTVFIDIQDNNYVNIVWSMADENGEYQKGKAANTPEWYKDNILLDNAYYSEFYKLYNSGACDDLHEAESALSTITPGEYDLRYIGGLRTNAPVIAVLSEATQIAESESNNNFSISPNPSNKLITINHQNRGDGIIKVFDLHGRLMHELSVSEGLQSTTINIESLNEGSYFLMLMSSEKILYRSRFIKL
jgi:hypothetical protein